MYDASVLALFGVIFLLLIVVLLQLYMNKLVLKALERERVERLELGFEKTTAAHGNNHQKSIDKWRGKA